ncbi:peptide transporter [Lasiosphaeria ovina]|uniref:Peptide transporter n=1 Tax=Lasiosphaeria ovina TaxID=92902 RepID=A0AAE0JVA0_9PEZI|nr:peptide transporter [Lasiosphaeria ovina]
MSAAPLGDTIIGGAVDPVSGKVVSAPPHQEVNEKIRLNAAEVEAFTDTKHGIDSKEGHSIEEIQPAPPVYDNDSTDEKDDTDGDEIIITGTDASRYLLSLRDDREPSATFRSLFLASCLAAFQAVMKQIYQFKPTLITIQGTFIVLIAYFVGNAWAELLPRGDRIEARWRARGGVGKPPRWINIVSFFNHGRWNLKEHAICAITATSASNAAEGIQVFAAQDLFYDLPLSAATVVLCVISIGLFGYGVAGIMRPIAVWHVDAVYWSTLPTVKTLQGLHWQSVKDNKPIRWFWIAFGGMAFYEFFPAYIWPWLNSVSIPCLAAMHATGSKAAVLTNLFGGATNNEGLGLFSVSLDWQYITSFQTALPLNLQIHQAVGFFVCFIVMLGIYYGNGWGAKSQQFMSTRLRTAEGAPYIASTVFVDGVLDEQKLAEYGIPRLTGTFAYSMFIANAAIGALIAHCILFWGGDIFRAFKSAKSGKHDDRHHEYMSKNYKEAPWWWYVAILVFSFVLGLIAVLKTNITLPAWAYIVSLLLGIVIAPFSTILYSRYGNGIATNNLSKMLGGLLMPGRPVGNMYFAAWSHNMIANAVNLSNDLKMGEYLKIPPRVMVLTQVYGTILGGFVNYGVMSSIVGSNRALLLDSDGNSSWSGATMQSYNTNAVSWALAKYLYKAGELYELVPYGLLIGAGLVAIHRLIAYFIPKVRGFSLSEINLPQFIQYAGYIPYNQSQTCVLFSWVIAGFYTQFYLRNYKPRIFKDYSYLIAGAFDGASLTVLFILSFAVFGAGGPSVPFPRWWGNNGVEGDANYDFCPVPDT